MTILRRTLSSCGLILFGFSALLPSARADPKPLEKVTLQLKWKHQFQFAGFYAAKHQGYYRREGLDVELKEKPQRLDVREEVLSRRAEYGLLTSDLLLLRARGDPVVVLAAILQHSPNALLVRRRAEGIQSPRDLIGRKVMLIPDQTSAEIHAMFRRLGIRPSDWEAIGHSYRHADMLEGKVSAMSVYVSDGPFFGGNRNEEFGLLRPITYGIDFYGDCLFTTQAELDEHPERARAFRRASLKGWEYAFAHPQELIDLILSEYHSTRSRAQLTAEAEAITELAQPVFIQVGQMNPDRWRRIGETYMDLGMIKASPPLEDFLYDPSPPQSFVWVWRLGALLLLVGAGAAAFAAWNVTLRRTLKEQTASLREREARYRAIVEDQTELICRTLRDGTVTFVNEACCRFAGRERDQLLGTNLHLIAHPADLEQVKANLASLTGDSPVSTSLHRAHDGQGRVRWTQWTFRLIVDQASPSLEIQCCGRDVTQRIEAEEAEGLLKDQLRQAQKMEAVGLLAGGVAHDFNNLLTVILGNTQLLERYAARNDGSSPAGWLEEVAAIQEAGERASDLTERLLAFGRKSVVKLEVLSLPDLIDGMGRILERLLRKDIRFSIALEPNLPRIRGDRGQLEQVFLNLVLNAQDAMPDGGDLAVRVAGEDLEATDVEGGSSPGPYLVLAVSDTGTGIADDVKDHIFEPFFTTKGVGHGTGLGLSTVYGVIAGLQGFVRVESQLGQGSTFSVYLPASEEAPSKLVTPAPSPAQHDQGTRQLVLVCEDEAEVGRIVQRALTLAGYQVLVATNGERALALASEHSGSIDLLVCDVIMPGKSGPIVAAELRTRRPNLPVLFISGHAQDALDTHGLENVELLRKPFELDELVARVAKLLPPAALAER